MNTGTQCIHCDFDITAYY